jgi:hypothetical protein
MTSIFFMTHGTPKRFHFSPLNGKKVAVSFPGGAISSDGGLLLLGEVDKKPGLTKLISGTFNDKRHPNHIDHIKILAFR